MLFNIPHNITNFYTILNTNTYININLKNLQCYYNIMYQQKINTFQIPISKYCNKITTIHHNNNTVTTTINLSQKKFNQKGTISLQKTLNTFTIGSIIKYFKIRQGKYIRRSIKGLKIFLNFIKNIFLTKYLNQKTNMILINIVGVDYNIQLVKKSIKQLLKHRQEVYIYTIYNIKVSFTKTKEKKIKSIKKRLKKKILKNFLKTLKNL